MTNSKINPHVLAYIEQVETDKIRACADQILLCAYVRKCFDTEDIFTDDAQLDKYLGLAKYFPFENLFSWEEFCIALHLCTYWRETGRPRWPDLFLLIGRGAGKDGFIAFESFCLISPHSNLQQYDVDICATAEDVAVRPVGDVVNVLESPQFRAKLKRYFYWTVEKVVGLKFKGVIRGRTNNPKSKDGMRSGMVVFNELHTYEDYKNIKVFVTSLGKKRHPRRLYATTNGDVREGPLDDYIDQGEMILRGEFEDDGFLPFMCRLDDKKEVGDESNWEKANPSLPYLPDLMEETRKEYREWKRRPGQNPDFMTKRMNRPQSDSAVSITEWENILATNRPMPDLSGWSCTVGIDYSSLRDWAAVNFHFRKGDERFDFGCYWVCIRNPELDRIKAPWRKWDTCVPVDDVEISPYLLTDYIFETAKKYNILKIALDHYRFALMKEALDKIGFDPKDRKNVYLVRPSDIMKVQPVIDSCFNKRRFSWGDNPALRWASNNTKLVRSGKKEGTDTGNFYYAKIEAKSRKTDPFVALVASMVIEDELGTGESTFDDLPVIVC
jgi:phage terminase large subunit-like protein